MTTKFENHQQHVNEHLRMRMEYEIEKQRVINQAEYLVKHGTSAEEMIKILAPFVSMDKLVYYYDRYLAENIIVNSPLSKVLKEEK
jgi:hypothetical protein